MIMSLGNPGSRIANHLSIWSPVLHPMNRTLPSFAAFLCLVLLLSPIAHAQTPVLMQHNDISRSGANTTEAILTPANVNSASFGRLFSYPVDGRLYAQPLYVPGVTINSGPNQGTTHNVVFVASENDSLYAFDADTNSGANANPLWKVSLIDAAHGAGSEETVI